MIKKQKSYKLILLSFRFIFVFLIVINLFFASWYVIHKDILFHTDIARDFLLLDEIDEKKIILIGPRSSTSGLFHGPLWAYLNYPAYVIGQGDPVVVGWFWIALIVIFLATSFIFAKKLFNETTAFLYTLLLSFMLIFESRALFNPHGALFLLPSFFYFFIKYTEEFKVKNLIILLLIAGLIIQFQMAIGIPMLILTTLPVVYFAIKKKHKKHLLSYFALLIPLSTFIVFEIKYKFSMLNAAMSYVFGNNLEEKSYTSYFSIILDRIKIMTTNGLGLISDGDVFKIIPLLLVLIIIIYFQVKQKKFKNIYLWAIYFYVGYFALTIVNKSGGMLTHYYMELWAITFLIFASLITSKYKYLFAGIFALVYLWNLMSLNVYLGTAEQFIGKNKNSWVALHEMSEKIYGGEEKEFGYFIYGPDTISYQAKYAMRYEAKRTNKNGYYFQKMPTTYLVIEPPPLNKPQFDGISWTDNQVGIKKDPQSVIKFSNGYKAEKYVLNEEEIKNPWDSTIDTGIHFR